MNLLTLTVSTTMMGMTDQARSFLLACSLPIFLPFIANSLPQTKLLSNYIKSRKKYHNFSKEKSPQRIETFNIFQ